MATIFVSAVDGNNADSGADWVNAKQSVAGALAIAGDGDVIKVDSAGTFNAGAAITWNPASTGLNIAIVSVDRANGDAWLAGAIEAINTTGQQFNIMNTTAGHFFIYGMNLKCGTGGGGSDNLVVGGVGGDAGLTFKSCTLTQLGSSTAALSLGSSGGSAKSYPVTFIDCSFPLRNSTTAAPISFAGTGRFVFINPTFSFVGASKPTTIFGFGGTTEKTVDFIDADFSGFDAGNLFTVTSLQSPVVLRNCKLHATPGIFTGSWPSNGGSLTLVNCDSGDTKYRFAYYNRLGQITATTSIYADGSATRLALNVGWEIITTSACNEFEPFIPPWLARQSTSTSSLTVSIEIASSAAVNDRNCWGEFEYVSSASFPLGTFVSGRNANPFTGSANDLTTTSTTWTGSPGSATQKASATFTPGEGSLLRGRLVVAVASKTLYLDPLLRVA